MKFYGLARISVFKVGLLALAASLGSAAVAQPRDPLPAEVTINGIELVLIPEGWFYKSGGVNRGDAENAGYVRVWLDAYYIAKYEARGADLARFLNTQGAPLAKGYGGDTIGCALQRDASGGYFEVEPSAKRPATHLSWQLADEWARWLGLRLPTEAEWEKAARGGEDRRTYPWGEEHPDDTFANFQTASDCLVWPVDSGMKGRSPYGIHHMGGNVREHVADWYNPEADRQLVDGVRSPRLAKKGIPPRGFDEPMKVIKGGRWASNRTELTVAHRTMSRIDDPFQCNGTRFAADAATVRAHLANGTASIVRR